MPFSWMDGKTHSLSVFISFFIMFITPSEDTCLVLADANSVLKFASSSFDVAWLVLSNVNSVRRVANSDLV